MKTSTEIGKLLAALATAQGAIRYASKDSTNPHFKSRYADLASIWDACRAPLAANGIAVVQFARASGKAVTVETLLGHASGEWMSDELTVEAQAAQPQAIGSAITYARRYALASVVGVAPDDDDGESAQSRPPPQRYERPSPAVVAAAMAKVEAATGVETLADKMVLRIQAAANIRPDLTGIASDIEDAIKIGALQQHERDSLFALLTARKQALVSRAA